MNSGKPYTHRLQYRRINTPTPHEISTGDLIQDVDPSYPHNYAGIIFYSDAAGTTKVLPSGGTITFTIATEQQPSDFQDVIDGTGVDAMVPNQVDWNSNSLQVKAEFTSITGASYARIVFTGNSS